MKHLYPPVSYLPLNEYCMKTVYNEHSKSGGTYKVTNLINGKVYIGSAKCFQVRASQHNRDLPKGKHGNKHLQSAWNIDGSDAFMFEVIQVIGREKQARLDAEQQLLDQFWNGCVDCYNVEKDARASRCGTKNSEKTKMKIRNALLGHIHTEEIKKKMSEAHRKKTNT